MEAWVLLGLLIALAVLAKYIVYRHDLLWQAAEAKVRPRVALRRIVQFQGRTYRLDSELCQYRDVDDGTVLPWSVVWGLVLPIHEHGEWIKQHPHFVTELLTGEGTEVPDLRGIPVIENDHDEAGDDNLGLNQDGLR